MNRLLIIVDDSETCAETLGIALESMPGTEVRILKSARAARATLEGPEEIVALITDFDMPGGSGFDLIDEVRAQRRFAELPILMVSGDSDPGIGDQAIARGASAFFSKPYSPAMIRRKLDQLVCSTYKQELLG
jgi:DNA-binding NtrC family response regulator